MCKPPTFYIVLYFGGLSQLLDSLVAFRVNGCLFSVLERHIVTVADFPPLPAEY